MVAVAERNPPPPPRRCPRCGGVVKAAPNPGNADCLRCRLQLVYDFDRLRWVVK